MPLAQRLALKEMSDLATDGYVLLSGAFAGDDPAIIAEQLAAEQPAVLRSRGTMYGSRDLISLWRSWSLPWHRDKTIAVKDNTLASEQFQRPTTKAGIPHVEAPQSLLEQMLTLRIQLDPMTPANGPLSVIPGSHRLAEESQAAPVEIHCAAGDVLAMRPLISHSSSAPHADNALHRRIVHLEFAPSPALPDGYQWQWFQAVD